MHEVAPLVLFAAVMCLTPGPNVVLATASAANFGFRRTLRQIAGITAGFGAIIARWLGRLGARRAFNGAMGGLLVLSLVPVFA
jgi:threonine/homoserine/homoserine lactone efflux protein